MKTDLLNLNKIFTDRIFRIPDYQRGYAWTEKQLKDFWSDLLQLEPGKNHYVGVLTLEDVSEKTYSSWREDRWIIESKSFSPFYIVDGQQRLTTSIILIQAILEANSDEQKLNYFTNNEIQKRFIFDSKDDGISRSYIFGYEKDNPSYEFLKTGIFCEKTNSNDLPQQTIYTQNLQYSKSFFKEKLENLKQEEREEIFKKITQHFLFNIYSMSEDIDVYITFETMNNRGKQLSILELLKNRLIFLSTKLTCDDNDKDQLRYSINEAWKSVYHFLGKNKDKLLDDDTFLLNHFFYYFGNKLFKDDEIRYRYHHQSLQVQYKDFLLENLFTIRNVYNSSESEKDTQNKLELNVNLSLIYDYVQSIKSSVETWFNILNPSTDCFSEQEVELLDRIYRIKRKAESDMFMILILVFYEKVSDISDRVALLNYIEKMMFFNTLTDRHWRLSWDDNHFLRMSIALSNGVINSKGVLIQLHDMWNATYTNDELMPEIIKNFGTYGFYGWVGLRYFLYEYEVYLKDVSKTNRKKVSWKELIVEDDSDYISVEHVYPQTARRKCWSDLYSHFTSKQRSLLKNSIGNLVPLSSPKNSSLSNNCFAHKKSRENDTVGYCFGGYSENEVALNEQWTAIEIFHRSIKMTRFFENRWGIKFTSNKQILDFIGIEFVIEKEKLSLDKNLLPKSK